LIKFHKLVEDCIDSMNYFSNFAQANFDLIISLDIRFKSDESTINTIIQNLVENSLKYAREGVAPEVKIRIEQANKAISIEIEDNVEGIKTEDQDKVFNMFYRANNRTKGTDLGLYLVKYPIEKLSGSFEFKSEENKGTLFKILLPKIGV
jgi:signal transduction histidine kinase